MKAFGGICKQQQSLEQALNQANFGYAFSIGNLSLNMMDGCIK